MNRLFFFAVEASVGEGFDDGYAYAWTVGIIVRVHGAGAQKRDPDEVRFSWLTNTSTYWRYTLHTASLLSLSFPVLLFPIANRNNAPDLRRAVFSTCRCQVRMLGWVERA